MLKDIEKGNKGCYVIDFVKSISNYKTIHLRYAIGYNKLETSVVSKISQTLEQLMMMTSYYLIYMYIDFILITDLHYYLIKSTNVNVRGS